MKRTLVTILGLLIGTASLYAQNEIDALRYSRHTLGGTARYVAMGGAFGALGADFSSLSNNPAGIGLYRSSEVTVTPTIFIGSTESTYFNDFNEDERYNFNIGNIGIVMVSNPTLRNPSSEWKNLQFGFGLNRLANFNNRVVIDGFNESSSYLTPYINDANENNLSLNDLDDFGSGLAYDTYLMGYDSISGNYWIDMPDGNVSQRKTMETRGSINEMVFTVGANYNDRVYLGATLGVPYIKYKESSIYTEEDVDGRNDYFKSFSRLDELETSGTGVNLKVGIIVRPSDWIRLGGAIETPTFYSGMSDSYSTTFKSSFDTLYDSKRKTSDGFYEYDLTTPFKAMASVGFILGKNGIISADYQYLDYSNARLRASDYDFDKENDAIREGYLVAHNLRFGAEMRLGSMSLRGGYSISANPYRYNTNSALSSYSGGIGFRGKKFFVDFTGLFSQMDDEHHLYDAPSNAEPAIAYTKVTNTMFLVTLGFKY